RRDRSRARGALHLGRLCEGTRRDLEVSAVTGTGTGDPVAVSLDVSAVPRQAVGVGRFVLDLVRVLEAREEVDLTLWCRREDEERWRPPQPRPAADGARSTRSLRALAPSARPLRLAWEQVVLPRLVDRCGASVHHAPHYTMPERTQVPCVVTVHDMTFFDHPEWHERSKVLLFRRAIRVASRRARALLCDSKRTAERLEELCRPKGRVFLVPLGVDLARFHPSCDARDLEIVSSLGVRPPYVLFLGTLEPRKAVPELVAAFDRLGSSHRELSLVLAGRPGWGAAEVERKVATARNRDRVVRTGYVPDEAVPSLLRAAAVVAYPAKEEGFGLPALEALSCGAPLVTTSGTVMAELAGSAALTAAPGSVEELAQALEEALSGKGSAERRRAGLEVAASHTWEASADAHLLAYRWAAGRL
ncbi:MAG: glycosyltransferase family 4 protein, partial [Acidimicrobiales bacterium]